MNKRKPPFGAKIHVRVGSDICQWTFSVPRRKQLSRAGLKEHCEL